MKLQTAIKPKQTTTLDALYRCIEPQMRSVDATILQLIDDYIPLISQLARHLIASGGKRLRPALTLISAQCLGYDGPRHVRLAAAVEFIHTATLLHDDVVDDSTMRRGKRTANDVWGNKASVLVGDFLLSQAFQIMTSDGNLDVLQILSQASATIARGEVMQLSMEGKIELTETEYLEIIGAKTAELFAAACEIGPIIADQPQHRAALRTFGQTIGLAFQLVDDALDYDASPQHTGKSPGNDFRECKITYPVLMSILHASPIERAFWERTLNQRDQQPDDFIRACTIIQQHQGIEKTFALARTYCDRAQAALAPLPDNAARAAMLEIVDFCASRTF